MYKHIVQTRDWAAVKNKYGNEAVRVGEIYYTIHKIPYTKYNYAYCPKVNPLEIDFKALKVSLKENNCIAVNFDVPNVVVDSKESKKALEILNKYCVPAKRSEFAKANVILNINKPEEDLFSEMYKKHRYNTRYAAKKGVEVHLAKNEEDFDLFFDLYKQTAIRQNYFIRPKKYYQIIWEELHPKGMCEILTAKYRGNPLASWMVFIYEDVIYYPYGGSSMEDRNVFASNALGWEVIRYGKSRGCKTFDMWGAAYSKEDEQDPYYGFTNFKLKYGGEHVRYIDSYDFVVNKPVYWLFTFANRIRWGLLNLGLIR